MGTNHRIGLRTHWIRLHMNDDNVTHSDSFGAEHIPKEIRYLQNTSTLFSNVWGHLYLICTRN